MFLILKKKIIIVLIIWFVYIKFGGKIIFVNLNNFSISEVCVNNFGFLVCIGMNVWLIFFFLMDF